MTTVHIEGATQDAIAEALSLLDDAIVTFMEKTEPPVAWFKLPKANSQRQAFLLAFYQHGPMTREQAKDALNLTDHSDCFTRVSELLVGGWLEETADRRRTRAGDLATIVQITNKARQAIQCEPKSWFPNQTRVKEN